MELYRCRSRCTGAAIGILALQVAIVLIAAFFEPHFLLNNEPSRELYGRDEVMTELVHAVDKFTFVSVCGVPGVGKSLLVKNVAKQLQNDIRYIVQNVDMAKLKINNISSLIERLYFLFDEKESVADNKKSDVLRFFQWMRNIQRKTKPDSILVLVLDNIIDRDINNVLYDSLIQPLLMSDDNILSKLKVIITSQYCFESKPDLHHKVGILSLQGINNSSCADWISTEYNAAISFTNSKQLCHLLGGIPLAIKMVASFIADPLRSYEYTADEVIHRLASSKIHELFDYLDKHQIISENSDLMKALFLVYDSLEMKYRQCVFLLTGLKSITFSHKHIVNSLKSSSEDDNFHNDCIEKLLRLSLMEKVPNSNSQEYQFNRLVMNFVQWLGEPNASLTQSLDEFKQMARRFWGNIVQNQIKESMKVFSADHCDKGFQLAVQIGSDKRLTNSLLPLIGKNFTLMPLFKQSLRIIIEELEALNFCNHKHKQLLLAHFKGQRISDVIYAYSYLVQAVSCADYHPTTLLMRADDQSCNAPTNNSCSDTCSKNLLKHGKELKMLYKSVKLDIKVAEAFGHYNALLMLTNCTRTTWRPFLFDLALIVATANSQCQEYCNRADIVCSCGSLNPLELGIVKFLMNDDHSSKNDLERELENQIIEDHRHCQTILKTLAIMTIHVINLELGRDAQIESTHYFQRTGLNYNELDPKCFLGVIADIVLPFLQEVHPDQDTIATLEQRYKNLFKMVSTSYKDGTDVDPFSRYALFYGLAALKATQLQETLKWPEEVKWIKPREVWVCSIIRDKTKKCQDSTKLPLLDQMISTVEELNAKTFFSLRYLMNDKEFSKWDEKVKNIPWFYQFMSI